MLLAAGQKALEVVAVGAAVVRTREKSVQKLEPRLPGCPSLRFCGHTCVVAVLFYIINYWGSTRWQAAKSRASARGLAGRGGRQGVIPQGGEREGRTREGLFTPKPGRFTDVTSGAPACPKEDENNPRFVELASTVS